MKNRTFLSTPFMIARRWARKLWVRVASMALMAALVSIMTIFFEGYLPDILREQFDSSAVLPILNILASGMLAVSTFSLNVMVSAYRAAAGQATPRAHRILLDDTTTQSVLSVFIGAFVYAFSAIILFRTGLHTEKSAVISMAVTVGVVILVIVAMVRWVDHLSDLGSMDATLRTIEQKARDSLINIRAHPTLSGNVLDQDTRLPSDALPLPAPTSGYLQMVDCSKMHKALAEANGFAWLTCRPGTFVLQGRPVGHVSAMPSDMMAKVQAALIIGDERTFEQDADYGLLILAETASRALSPGINDAGTAIDVIARLERLLWHWGQSGRDGQHDRPPPEFARVFISDLDTKSMVDTAFSSIARDGAGQVEVVTRLLRSLELLQDTPDTALAEAARDMAKLCHAHADASLTLEQEKDQISGRSDLSRQG